MKDLRGKIVCNKRGVVRKMKKGEKKPIEPPSASDSVGVFVLGGGKGVKKGVGCR